MKTIKIVFFTLSFCCLAGISEGQDKVPEKVPVIVVTDLYHPFQDPGDNFDLITPFALPEIDLKAIILDCTETFRWPYAFDAGKGLAKDVNGPRDPGFIQVLQLNYIFGRGVPCAAGPFRMMKSTNDKITDVQAFQQQGIELFLRVLKESEKPVTVASFGSARTIAAAFNRDPELCKQKIKLVHLSAGSNMPNVLEWNVALDTNAIVTVLRSGLPVAIYPCGANNQDSLGYGFHFSAFSYDSHNTFYKLPNLKFINKMEPKLHRYLNYSFGRITRNDFLRCMDSDTVFTYDEKKYSEVHFVWETAVWINISNRKLVKHSNGKYEIIPSLSVVASDMVLPNDLQACKVSVPDNGIFSFSETKENSNFSIFYRGDYKENEKALLEALPAMYMSFKP